MENAEQGIIPVAKNKQEILDLLALDRPFDLACTSICFAKDIRTLNTHLSDAIKRSKTLKSLSVNFRPLQYFLYWEQLVDVVLVNRSIKTIAFANIPFSVHTSAVRHICKILDGMPNPDDTLTRDDKNGLARATLKKLHIVGGRFTMRQLDILLQTLRHNKVIKNLVIGPINDFDEEQLRAILTELRHNDTLRTLHLSSAVLTELSGFVEFLKQNRSVENINVAGHLFSERYWKIVEEALIGNQTIYRLEFIDLRASRMNSVPASLKSVLLKNWEYKMEKKQAKHNMKMLVQMIVKKPRAYLEKFPREIWTEILKNIQLPGANRAFNLRLITTLNKDTP
jgi:hypothetical protein